MAEFKNPNQSSGQDGRSMLVMMAALLIAFAGLQFYNSKKKQQTPATPAAQTQQAAQNAAPASAAAPPVSPVSPSAPSAQDVAAASEQITTIENELYRITFTNHGAQVTSWVLKNFKDAYDKPLDLVHQDSAKKFGYPLSLYSYDAGLTGRLAQAMYVPSVTGVLSAPATLSFVYSGNGLEVKKSFTFDESYVLHTEYEVKLNGATVRTLLAWPGAFGDQAALTNYLNDQIDTSNGGHEEHTAAKKISGGNTISGPFQWAGLSDAYFAAIILPDAPETATMVTLNHELNVPKEFSNGKPGNDSVKVPALGAAVGDQSGRFSGRIYAGPKLVNVLKTIKAADGKTTLEALVDFGFFGFIGKYLFLALQLVHTHIASNWGWAIIVLTVIINIILLPLRVKTMQSSLKMQRIQPQMDAIKAKYAKYKVTDPKRADMNSEIMDLQKREGVNMFGGCLPSLIQLPLLLAFFNMLTKVVELRGAHWFWLPDLQAPDPYHILPILMMISQFVVQFYTPSPGVDPQQQRMMAFMMPAISGYFTWSYASGLALYWSVGNLLNILQQAVMNRTKLGTEMKELAAKRARRKGNATIQGRR